MSKKSTQSLIDSAKKGLEGRPAGRLQSMVEHKPPKPIAVPLSDDAYEIEVDHIKPDPNQPRKTFNEADLSDLASSIKENGVLQPLVVYQGEDPEFYTLITGERRWRAAQLAGFDTVPCIVRRFDYDKSLIDQAQLVENIQRADLEPIEAARALTDYQQRHELSQKEASKRLGKPRTWIVELQSILKIPDELLEKGKKLPKQALVEIARAPATEQAALMDRALESASPLEDVKQTRSNRETKPRVVYYSEKFALEDDQPIEIRWKKHPQEVTDQELAEALGKVVRTIVGRAVK